MTIQQRLMSLIRVFQCVYTPVLQLLLMSMWPLPLLHKCFLIGKQSKRVLLITQNVVALDHMRDIHNLLNEYPGVVQFVTTDWLPTRQIGRRDIEAVIDTPYIHILSSLLRHWDLIIFTNHPFGLGIWFSPLIKKLYVNHGIHVGKINNDKEQDGVYGRYRVLRQFNKPFYTRLFASSEYERDLALRATPELAGCVAVTGYLRADRLVENSAVLRRAGRSKFGYAETDKVVHIISTWGEQSLIAAYGASMFDQVKRLTGQFKFILSLHPRYDEFNKRGGESRLEILQRWESAGVRVDRNTDWEEFVATADLSISDHSSLCLYHALLNHPLLLVDIPQGQYLPGSTFALMKSRLPVFTAGGDLGALLSMLSDSDQSSDLALIRDNMLSYQGEAAQRYRAEIAGLLGLQRGGESNATG